MVGASVWTGPPVRYPLLYNPLMYKLTGLGRMKAVKEMWPSRDALNNSQFIGLYIWIAFEWILLSASTSGALFTATVRALVILTIRLIKSVY